MAMESQTPGLEEVATGGALRRTLLFLSIAIMVIGGPPAPLFTRMYFLHGGARLWLTSLLQNCGFPVLFLPLAVAYLRREGRQATGNFSVTGRGTAACLVLGVICGLGAYMYAYSSASLPVSTTTLLNSTQLAFTAVFAFLVVRQRFTAYSINAVVLLVMGPVVLGQQSDGDRPAGESNRLYYMGFFVMIGSAAVFGLLTPLIELTQVKMKQRITYVMVIEMQLVMAISASVFCLVAMLINKDFQAISREAKEYGLGETKYFLVLFACAISWQLMNVGFVGVIAYSSSLLAGIVIAVLVPLGELVPVVVLHEKFNGGKAVAMALSIWGFVSYLYGEHQQHKKQKLTAGKGVELPAAP